VAGAAGAAVAVPHGAVPPPPKLAFRRGEVGNGSAQTERPPPQTVSVGHLMRPRPTGVASSPSRTLSGCLQTDHQEKRAGGEVHEGGM